VQPIYVVIVIPTETVSNWLLRDAKRDGTPLSALDDS
jgi:hypothetical protein